MIPQTAPASVRQDHIARREIALIDLREEDTYAKDHPLFAANLPLSRLELEVLDRVPRKDTKIVVYDAGEGLVSPAFDRLRALGYTDVSALADGLLGWRLASYELFQDVNSASKAFGELVESRRHTPSLPAPDAKALIEAEPNLVVLDARRFEEFHTMSIPRGVSVPGAELVLRARALAPDPSTTIIVNCAGRTRSIIGAQSLINAGVPNKVLALRNGTIGWTLAGQDLEHGQTERYTDVLPDREAEARAAARDVSYRAGVRHIDTRGLDDLARDVRRTLYRFDVRTPEEYAAGHIKGFRSAPGGQLVQETDVFAPVRGARVVLADDRAVRADMSASWLAQMGWEVYVLDGGFERGLELGPWKSTLPPLPDTVLITPEELSRRQAWGGVAILDLALSPVYGKGHIPGAWFAVRSRLAEAMEVVQPRNFETLVLTSPDGILARLAAAEIAAITRTTPLTLDGGTAAWTAAGLPLATDLVRRASPPDDVYRRPYEGTDNAASAMQAYLDWEFGLVEQLRRDGTHGFFVI